MDNINWKDIPAFLDEEQRKDPLSVIQTYFEETSLYDARIHMWDLLSFAIESDVISIYSTRDRSCLFYFFMQTLDLLEANQLLSEMITQKKLSYTTEGE
jgi:hypothetical protein